MGRTPTKLVSQPLNVVKGRRSGRLILHWQYLRSMSSWDRGVSSRLRRNGPKADPRRYRGLRKNQWYPPTRLSSKNQVQSGSSPSQCKIPSARLTSKPSIWQPRSTADSSHAAFQEIRSIQTNPMDHAAPVQAIFATAQRRSAIPAHESSSDTLARESNYLPLQKFTCFTAEKWRSGNHIRTRIPAFDRSHIIQRLLLESVSFQVAGSSCRKCYASCGFYM